MEPGLCERVGCGEPQVCALLIAPQETQAWLVSPAHPSASEGVSLCDTHADRISVPFGWTLVDDRAKPKRKRRKKKAEPAPATDATAEPPGAPTAPTLPIESDLGAGTDSADDYVEPEYQFREDSLDLVEGDADQPEAVDVVPDSPDPEPPPVSPDDATDDDPDGNADEEPESRLSVVPGSETADTDATGDLQGALWDNSDAVDTEPDESTPLLQRAFRVVRDD